MTELPFYEPSGNEISLFEHAFNQRLPLLIKGPTGCGKTRFVAHMAARLNLPLYTVACHDDLTAADLVGRHLISDKGTYWCDGPLTRAVREGGICYLDEIVEARQDTTVVIHPLTDHRRVLPLDKKGELVSAHPDFQLVISYNPGYQSLMKDLKPSTKQRFTAFDFDYPDAALEARIVVGESGLAEDTATRLVTVAQAARRLKGHGLTEGISTRLLVHAAQLMQRGVDARDACRMALVRPITDDADIRDTLDHAVDACFA